MSAQAKNCEALACRSFVSTYATWQSRNTMGVQISIHMLLLCRHLADLGCVASGPMLCVVSSFPMEHIPPGLKMGGYLRLEGRMQRVHDSSRRRCGT